MPRPHPDPRPPRARARRRFLCAAGLLLAAAGAAPPAGPPELSVILKEAQRVQREDTAAWSRFRFQRLWQREEFDEEGGLLEREVLEYRITPNGHGFDEELVRRNGAPPEEGEIEKHRRQARFTRHYQTMIEGGGQGNEGGYSLSHLLRLSAYRYAGREHHGGVPCHRLDFSPDEENPKTGISGKFANAMAGSVWITVDGHHLAGVRSRSLRPISLYLSLGKVHHLELNMESAPAAGGVWLPRRIEVTTRARVLIKAVRRKNLYEYSAYEPAPRGDPE